MRGQLLMEALEQHLNPLGVLESLPEQPDGLGVRNPVFEAFVSQVVPVLEHQHLEHEHDVDGIGASDALPGLLMYSFQVGTEGFPSIWALSLTNGSPISVNSAARVSRSKNPGWRWAGIAVAKSVVGCAYYLRGGSTTETRMAEFLEVPYS